MEDADFAAEKLCALGLFKGVGTSGGRPVFALQNSLTRQEGVVLLVRLLGKESAAKSGTWPDHPFRDVDAWADPYFDYAWDAGLVRGVSADSFNAGGTLQACEFLTLVLRALGYTEGADFSWDRAWALSDATGLTRGDYRSDAAFLRGDAARISYRALGTLLCAKDVTLLSALVDSGAVKAAAVQKAGLGSLLSAGPMTARQMYDYVSPAVLLLKTYSSDSVTPFAQVGSGSAVLISGTGVAVTNYHVLEGSRSAVATLSDGTMHDVESILYANKNRDLCVFRLSAQSRAGLQRESFPSLSMAGHDTVYTGDEIYTVGCPLGLSASISDGVVGNRLRIVEDFGGSVIQISAPISHGSSGGALLNVYGQLIGITTGTYVDSQSMNLAIPVDEVMTLDLSLPGQPYLSMNF